MPRCFISLLLVTGGLATAATGTVPLCLPPDPPAVPDSDRVLKDYADMIQADFDDYFAGIADFTACLDHARGAIIAQAEGVSASYHTFLDRARSLGVTPATPTGHRLASEELV